MNFLGLRSSQTAVPEKKKPPPPPLPVHESPAKEVHLPRSATLEGLIAEDPFPEIRSSEDDDDGFDVESERLDSSSGITKAQVVDTHVDVSEDEGWITIPYKEIPENWREVPEIDAFRSLDRSFVFPGEQVHILACLSACKQDIEIITPFKVAAAMNKNGIRHSTDKQNGSTREEVNLAVDGVSGGKDINQNGNSANYGSSGESLLRMEDHRQQTERLLRRFSKSHFFVRIADSDEPLWSKRSSQASADSFEMGVSDNSGHGNVQKRSSLNAVVDRGNFDSSTSGGIARDAVQCHALPNGDIVVLLQINVGVDFSSDPVLEVLQFEKYRERDLASKNGENLAPAYQDPCGELLRWLLPVDNSMGSPARTISPSHIAGPNIRSTSTKSNFSASSGSGSGSQLFSFSNFRSYSMSSLPPDNAPTSTVTTPNSRASFDPEESARFSYQKSVKSGSEGLLSFRGVPLEPERFSVRCGLEGTYIPGRRWRRKIEIIQPVEINSFAADCNTDDLICVQIKNIAPAHASNILVYVDAITIVSEDPSKGGLPSSFPIACIEAGNEHSLPDLALRRGEDHSFILKPALSLWKHNKGRLEGSPQSGSQSHPTSNEVKHSSPIEDQYAILVSCRCNYTESRLFFKQQTNWRPRVARDLLISVVSETSKQTLGSNGKVAQLPVQVMTLQATNLTSEDLTLTVLAPASFTSPPSVVSLSSSPLSPLSPLAGSEFSEKGSDGRQSIDVHKSHSRPANQGQEGEGGSQPVSFNEQTIPISEVLPSGDLGCTHLWLQSKVPLGCVPSQSMASIKLEVLPLTDGIITLDSLQIDVKERGVTYIPEHSLKINAKSSISAEIV